MNKSLAIFGGSTLLYAGLAIVMGVLPGIWLSQVPPGPGVKPLTPEEEQGRDVYVSEGCAYCHTQQVRPMPGDALFGRPTAPGDLAYQTPELLGSERNGPDLTNVGARQSSRVWQYIHLYEPRAVVPQSIMPAFPWLFEAVDKPPAGENPVPLPSGVGPEHGVVIPGPKAKVLVDYLLSLKQPPLPTAQGAPPGAGGLPTQGAPEAAVGAPPLANAEEGAKLFASTCAACHGADGKGVPGAFPPLAGDPVVNAADPTEHISTVLHGASGRMIGGQHYQAQMPSFASQFSDAQIAAIIDHERSSWGNHGRLISAADVTAVRNAQAPQQAPSGPLPPPGGPAAGALVAPAQPPAAGAPAFDKAEGAKLFADTCAVCHGAEGKGIPGACPPLENDPVVNDKDPTEHIQTVLNGAHGRTIGGTKYEVEMPGFASQFSDAQIANIIDHERTSWGNDGPLVTPADVAAQRAKK
jgi:cytochrome c oxidase cbb3-type subunit 2